MNANKVDKPHRDAAIRISAAGMEAEPGTSTSNDLGTKWDTADAIEANSWALRWADYGSDAVVEDWIAWLKRMQQHVHLLMLLVILVMRWMFVNRKTTMINLLLVLQLALSPHYL